MRTLLTAVITSLAMCGATLAQTVYYLPQFQLHDMTDDGRTAIGMHHYPINNGPGTRVAATWSVDSGYNDFGFDASFPSDTSYGYGQAISGDGSVYYGYTNNGSYRYTGPGSYQHISNTLAPSYKIDFTHASRDGSAAIGYIYPANTPFPTHITIRWTAATGVRFIGLSGSYSEATGMSRDGNTVVGYAGDAAWTWNTSTGTRQLLGLGGRTYAEAYAVTGDGRTVVGRSSTGEFESEAVIWRDGIVSALGRIDGYNQGRAESICDDASIIVGQMAGPGTRQYGVIWTSEGGPELLTVYFARIGVSLPDNFASAPNWRVSADGRTLYYNGGNESYVVTIPTPTAMAILTSLGVISCCRRRR